MLEFETKDAFIGAYSSGVEELEILPDDVSSISFKKGLFRTRLTINARSMKLFEKIPGAKHGKIVLRFKKKHRADAKRLATFLQHRLEELQTMEANEPAPLLDTGQRVSFGEWT